MNGTNDRNLKVTSSEMVDLIASGYDWTCPVCDTWEHEIEITTKVTCSGCGTVFRTADYEHAWK